MSASLFAFPARGKGPQPWTNDELAELYRVVEILGRAGLAVETDMGLSDEGEPWFVFCRSDSGDVIAHFARIDGQFVAASIAVDETYKGANFRQIVDQMVQSQPLMLPPPSRGTRLLLHPSVILTAFVATALAHSEKAHISDTLRPVEAKWDHAPGADDHGAVRHAKVTWFESLQTLLKGGPGDQKLGHGEVTAGQAITLASLIAIAMSAVQPVVEKLSFIAEAITEEFHDKAAPIQTASADHQTTAATDLPVIDAHVVKSDDSIVVKSQPDDNAVQQSKKFSPDVASADSQKTVGDGFHGSGTAAQKAAAAATTADDSSHLAASAHSVPEYQPELSVASILPAQKAVQSAVPASVDTTVHSDAAASPLVISYQDVTSDALQVLNIHIDPQKSAIGAASSDGSLSSHSVSSDASASLAVVASAAAASSGSIVSASTNSAAMVTSSPSVVQPQSPAASQTIEITADNGVDVVNAISNFTTSGQHNLATQVTPSTALSEALAPFSDPSHSLKVVVFESTSLKEDVFLFSPGVVFVEEKFLPQAAAMVNPGGNLILDLSSGGSVTLVGVATIGPTVA